MKIFILTLTLVVAGVLGGKVDKTKQDPYHYGFTSKARSGNIQAFEDADFWYRSAQSTLASNVQRRNIEKQAKNVIFFLGDGMSLATITAARTLKGEMEDLTFNEDGTLSFEAFPNVALSKTYCSDSQVADSACSATAYLTGTKANTATIGVKPNVFLRDCKGMMDPGQQSHSVLAWAQAAGKATGVVTTTRITHASPSGTYAHIAHRDWENDAIIAADGENPDECDDIAEQLIRNEPGKNINVIFGGGRREFVSNTVEDVDETGKFGKRTDGKNLIEEWKAMKASSGDRAKYIVNKAEFDSLDVNNTDYVMGLFNYDHLDYVLDKQDDPSLSELTKKAIEILSRDENGFFLFVEGGRIDHAHHDGKAKKALTETIEFSNAIQAADEMTSIEDTLILVTADHAHTLTISGYPVRGNPIMGIAEISEDVGPGTGDSLPYATLSYANGPGYHTHPHGAGNSRYDISRDNMDDKEYHQDATVPLEMESHGGDDVIIYSRGPFSHLLRGVVQQSYIPHVVGYASGTSPWLNFGEEPEAETTTDEPGPEEPTTPDPGDGVSGLKSSLLATIGFTFVALYAIYH